jgi:hypothetical protein
MKILDYIKVSFQENFTINFSRLHMERGGKHNLFLCIGASIHKYPHDQAKSRQRINMQNNQLEGPYLALLNHLIDRQPPSPGQIVEDIPMHEEEPELEEVQDFLIDEPVVPVAALEEEDEHLQPYQLTFYNRNELIHF